jgi:hypothetical protein
VRQLRRVGLGEAIDKFGALVGTNSQYLRKAFLLIVWSFTLR